MMLVFVWLVWELVDGRMRMRWHKSRKPHLRIGSPKGKTRMALGTASKPQNDNIGQSKGQISHTRIQTLTHHEKENKVRHYFQSIPILAYRNSTILRALASNICWCPALYTLALASSKPFQRKRRGTVMEPPEESWAARTNWIHLWLSWKLIRIWGRMRKITGWIT